MKLNWNPSFSASALHAAESIARNQVISDTNLEDALKRFTQQVDALAASIGVVETWRFWEQLVAHSADIDNNRTLAERVLAVFISGYTADHIATNTLTGLVSDIEAAFKLAFPKLDEQLPLRIGPLRDSWETFGPGLLAHIGRMTERKLVVDCADVVAVQPVLNGYGAAHLFQNRIRIEAVLINPTPELPEAVRMAWLLSQLNLDLPRLMENIRQHRIIPLAGLAMLPPVLAAAKILEIADINESYIDLAIEQWQIAVPGQSNVAAILLNWWETYLQTQPDWAVAMTALEKMLID